MIGTTISHYRITDKLGQGDMGEVFLAHDTSLDRKVALKFLPDIFSGDPERLARFEREAKVLASLNHPNIAASYILEVCPKSSILQHPYELRCHHSPGKRARATYRKLSEAKGVSAASGSEPMEINHAD